MCACKFDDWLVGRLHAFVRRHHVHLIHAARCPVNFEVFMGLLCSPVMELPLAVALPLSTVSCPMTSIHSASFFHPVITALPSLLAWSIQFL